jgi:hypothetical protein
VPLSSPLELDSDETILFRFTARRVQDRLGGAGDGEGGKGGVLRSSPSTSDNVVGIFLRTFDLGLPVDVEAPNPVDRVDRVDFWFAADLQVGSGVDTVTCLGLELDDVALLVGEGSESILGSSPEEVGRMSHSPFGLGLGLGLTLGMESDPAGDDEGGFTFLGTPALIGNSFTVNEVDILCRTSLSSSELSFNLALGWWEQRSGGLPPEGLGICFPFFGEVTESGSMEAEVDAERTTVELGLVWIRTYGTDLLGTRAKPIFLTVLGSEGGLASFMSLGRSSSVSSSLRERSMIKGGLCLLAKMDGARGCGSGNSKSTSLKISSRVFREVEATGCRRGVGESKRAAVWGRLLESSCVHDNNGDEERENGDEGPGDDESGGENVEAGISGLGVLRARYPQWTPP